MSGTKDAFFLRTASYVRGIKPDLQEWNADGRPSTERGAHPCQVLAICDGVADGGPSRATCRTFLAEQPPESPDPSI